MQTPTAFDQLLNLTGKTAIITGSAGGIGMESARRLHEAGARVVLADMNEAGVVQFADELNQLRGESAIAMKADVSSSEAVDHVVAQAVEHFDGIDILINNAGIFPFTLLAEMSEEEFSRVIDVNLKSVFLLTKAVSEQMKTRGQGGKIINITSIDAIHPSMAGLAHYDASKHGVYGFTKNVALELAQYDITVNAVAPGGVATPGTGAIDGEAAAGSEAMAAAIPMKRMGYADEIAKVVLFMASGMSSYMTGEQVVVDGGFLLK